MNLILTLQSELLKTRRSSLIYLCLAAAVLGPALMLFDYGSEEGLRELAKDPWNRYFQQGTMMLNLLFLPMFLVLTFTLLPQLEYRNNTWKQVLTAPQPISQLLVAKLLVGHLFVILFLLLYNLFLLGSLVITGLSHPSLQLFSHSLDVTRQLTQLGTGYGSALAISGLHFWLGLRSRSFLLPLGIGIAGWFTTMLMLTEFKVAWAKATPFGIPLCLSFPKYAAEIPTLLGYSAGYAVFFLALTFLEFRFRGIRE